MVLIIKEGKNDIFIGTLVKAREIYFMDCFSTKGELKCPDSYFIFDSKSGKRNRNLLYKYR